MEKELFETACSLIASKQSIIGLTGEFDAYQSKLVAAGILTESVTVFENVSRITGGFDEAIARLKPDQAKLLTEYTIWDDKLIAFARSIENS
ncbi:hypothetical protein [Antarctobacter heliothermus]|uniref:Uncharacterized protein n=1 Tax=Antarctobacter heliothermus TaxID=74033 RepID=A0A239ITZ7_9RHOB|nr:hypothetical protein [Antarctobacter heliothermus]SNS97057.1 hypothetical protein SAMN04488078_10462 [Antarctobacter heliothermus]